MSVYNGALHVREALESILSQTYSDWECIIVDDGSTDETYTILQSFQKSDARIKIYRHDTRQGLTVSLCELTKMAQGMYIARIDADDIALPHRFEKQVAYMQTHPHVGLCGTQGWYINECGEQVGVKNVSRSQPITKKELLWNNQCIHSSWMVRKTVLDHVGSYNALFQKSQDYDLLLRIGQHYEISNISERLIQWRVSQNSLSWQNRKQEQYALLARWYAIRRYGYPVLYGVWCIVVRLLWYIVPMSYKRKRYAC